MICFTKKLTYLVGVSLVISVTGITLANAESIDSNSNAVEVEDKVNDTSEIEQQYQLLKDSEANLTELLGLVTELNQIVDEAEAWEILANVYYDNGYYNYALYAASEAVDLGVESENLQYILLNSSVILAEQQIDNGYLENITDKQFLEQYQAVLSKIYGDIHNFNYDESLPKPVIRAKKRTHKAKSNKKGYKRKHYRTAKSTKQPTKSKQRSRTKASQAKKPTSSKKTNPSSPPKPKKSIDPFILVR